MSKHDISNLKQWFRKQKFKLKFYKYEILFALWLLMVTALAISLIYYASSRIVTL